jgi:hypothetical protein
MNDDLLAELEAMVPLLVWEKAQFCGRSEWGTNRIYQVVHENARRLSPLMLMVD